VGKGSTCAFIANSILLNIAQFYSIMLNIVKFDSILLNIVYCKLNFAQYRSILLNIVQHCEFDSISLSIAQYRHTIDWLID
jgi:hypothetical protein